MVSDAITPYFAPDLRLSQISEEAAALLEKVFTGEELTEQDRSLLVNPTEAAALLSVKYRRAIRHRYIKELARDIVRKEGPVTPARLQAVRLVGTTAMYRAGDVLAVPMRATKEQTE